MNGPELLAAIETLGLPEIGRSSQGHPVRLCHLGAGRGQPLLLVGGVHGDEPASVEAVLVWMATWSAPPDRELLIVPALNPDGIAANRKDSARGVDLNRNFPARNFTTVHPPGYDPGSHGGSEPETQALVQLVEQRQPSWVVAVHAPFACINHDGPSAAWAEAVARACGWPARADLGYPTPGSLGSWLGVERGLPVLTIELPAGPLQGFREPALAALRAATHPMNPGIE